MNAKTSIFAALVVIAISAFPAHSANKNKPKPKAPAQHQALRAAPSLDLAGISFGQPITFQECPSEEESGDKVKGYRSYKSEYGISTSSKPCWQHYSHTSKPMTPLPTSGKIQFIPSTTFPGVKKINVELIDGVVEDITLITYGEGVQDKLYANLSGKYGVPQIKDIVKIQNRMGADFNNIVAEWKFTDLTILFSGVIDRIDTGIISASTPRAVQAQESERLERNRSEPKL